MKILPKKNVSLKKQEDFIAIERNVLAKVDHPFIIKMFYAFQNSKKLFFVLEFCSGGELYRQISKKHSFP
jgi:serine/threonine protein kinase